MVVWKRDALRILRSSLVLASRPPHILRHHSIVSSLSKRNWCFSTPYSWGVYDGDISNTGVKNKMSISPASLSGYRCGGEAPSLSAVGVDDTRHDAFRSACRVQSALVHEHATEPITIGVVDIEREADRHHGFRAFWRNVRPRRRAEADDTATGRAQLDVTTLEERAAGLTQIEERNGVLLM